MLGNSLLLAGDESTLPVIEALGRKNFLFCGNHDASIRAAIVYSLVDSCKALDVDPREWMEDVLLRIPGNENNREVPRELLPNKWAKQTN